MKKSLTSTSTWLYLERIGSEHELNSVEVSKQEMCVSNIKPIESLKKAIWALQGDILNLSGIDFPGKTDLIEEWEIRSDIYNNTYFYCLRTGAKAYFEREEGIHYFTYFEGNKKSLLFYFYLAAFKVIFGHYRDLQIHDILPLNAIPTGGLGWIQDITAPFIKVIRPLYSMRYMSYEDDFDKARVVLGSRVRLYFRDLLTKEMDFEIQIDENTINAFTVKLKKLMIKARSTR